ncbi:MAG: universal stress protein [Geminicoccaceae bacterium]
MSEVFIVGFDGTEPGRRAGFFGAKRALGEGASVHVVHVLEWSPYSFLTVEELAERHKRRNEEVARAESVVLPFCQELEATGVKVTYEIRYGHAGALLCQIAEEKKACQIIVGRQGSSAFSQRLLGGLAITLAQGAPVPVTIVP